MLLKDRVILITNVEKFAGHGTTQVALAARRHGSGPRPHLRGPERAAQV